MPVVHRIGAGMIEHDRLVTVGAQQIREQHWAVLVDDRRVALDGSGAEDVAGQIGGRPAAALRDESGDAPQHEGEQPKESDATQHGYDSSSERSM